MLTYFYENYDVFEQRYLKNAKIVLHFPKFFLMIRNPTEF